MVLVEMNLLCSVQRVQADCLVLEMVSKKCNLVKGETKTTNASGRGEISDLFLGLKPFQEDSYNVRTEENIRVTYVKSSSIGGWEDG